MSALLLATACPGESDPDPQMSEGETETEPEPTVPGETDPDQTDPGETDPDDTDPVDTDPGDTDTEGELEADCSCYFDELAPPDFLYCLSPEEIVPGCDAEEPPCDTIAVTLNEAEDPPTVEISNPEALECVVGYLGADDRVPFTISTSNNLGGDTDTYWPADDGYVHIRCSLYDNPPESLSVDRLEVADPNHFSDCVKTGGGEVDAQALYTCLTDGLSTNEDDPLPICG